MTKVFERGIKAVEALPPDQQDLAGERLLAITGKATAPYRLTPEQLEDLKASTAEADRGEFAIDQEVEEMWRSFER